MCVCGVGVGVRVRVCGVWVALCLSSYEKQKHMTPLWKVKSFEKQTSWKVSALDCVSSWKHDQQ